MEGGFATLQKNLVPPPPFPMQRSCWGGAHGATLDAGPVFARGTRTTMPPTVVHELPHYVVVEESPLPPPRLNPLDSVSPPPSPSPKTYIQRSPDSIPHLIRPSLEGRSGGEHFSSGGAPAPVSVRPAPS